MELELARQRAAQAWCTPTTENIIMVPELAFAFADILEEEWQQPRLGNATTRELLEEIKARIELELSEKQETIIVKECCLLCDHGIMIPEGIECDIQDSNGDRAISTYTYWCGKFKLDNRLKVGVL